MIMTTEEMIAAAKQSPLRQAHHGRVLVRLTTTGVPGVRKHIRALWYVAGRRVGRAAAAIVLREQPNGLA